MKFVAVLCAMILVASACGVVKPAPGDATSNEVCKFDVDKFDSACVLAP